MLAYLLTLSSVSCFLSKSVAFLALIATNPCSSKTLRCGYHGRTFGLDGCMKNMPEFDDVEDFPSQKDDLKEFQIMEWRGLYFVGGNKFFDSVSKELERISVSGNIFFNRPNTPSLSEPPKTPPSGWQY